MNFFSPEVALYLYKCTIRPCMEYCYHVWAGAPSCYLELLEKLQKQICIIVASSLVASFEPLTHHQNGDSLSLFYMFSIVFFNWFQFLFLEVGLLVILRDCMIFLSPFLDPTRISIATFSFLTS